MERDDIPSEPVGMQFLAKFQAMLCSEMCHLHVVQFVVCFAITASDMLLRALTLTSLSFLGQLVR